MCLSESDYSDYDFTSTVHYDNCTTLSLVVSTFPLPLTSQDPIVPIVFRDPSSIVVVPTVIYELQISHHRASQRNFTNLFLSHRETCVLWAISGMGEQFSHDISTRTFQSSCLWILSSIVYQGSSWILTLFSANHHWLHILVNHCPQMVEPFPAPWAKMLNSESLLIGPISINLAWSNFIFLPL